MASQRVRAGEPVPYLVFTRAERMTIEYWLPFGPTDRYAEPDRDHERPSLPCARATEDRPRTAGELSCIIPLSTRADRS